MAESSTLPQQQLEVEQEVWHFTNCWRNSALIILIGSAAGISVRNYFELKLYTKNKNHSHLDIF